MVNHSRLRRLPALPALLILLLLAACATTPPGFSRPNGVAVAADGSIYVMDRSNHRVVQLAADGGVLRRFGQLGYGAGDIYSGWDIVLDSAGRVYICNHAPADDQHLPADGIKIFSPDGVFISDLGSQSYQTEEIPAKPYGLEIDQQDRLYVADFDLNRLRVFERNGQELSVELIPAPTAGLSATQDINGLNDVAVDDRRQLLYLVDATNSQIRQYALDFAAGRLILREQRQIGGYGQQDGQLAHPQNLAVDEALGLVYVSDMANRRIQAFDSAGRHVLSFSPNIAIWQPIGLAVGPDGAIYVADAFNNAVWIFNRDGSLRRKLEG